MKVRPQLNFDQKTIDRVNGKMKMIMLETRELVKEAMSDVADLVLERSQMMIPVDTTTAKSTGIKRDVQAVGPRIHVEIGYGLPESDAMNPKTGKMASAYVLELHEDLAVFHATGTAKFLEDAVNASRDDFSKALEKAVTAGIIAGAGGSAK